MTEESLFDQQNIWKILLKIAPPVMLAQLIQALYNIVDSYFVGQYSENGLTALSVIFPIQLVITAIAVGTGVGVNTKMSRHYAKGETEQADCTAGTGMVLAAINWFIFSIVSFIIMRPYVQSSAESQDAVELAITYGNIVCLGSLGIFLESNWSKVHQAGGNMRLPMIAQISGAITNILLDPLLIFGWGFIPATGIAGAAYATVVGQFVAALITASGFRRPPCLRELSKYVKKIYKLGYPSILMQMLYTVYITALNIILASFSDSAVTVLGLYYKMQSFFFIPLSGLQTCIVPLLSYTYARREYLRCKKIMTDCVMISMGFMLIGVVCFECMPVQLLGVFSSSKEVFATGSVAFRIIGLSFVPAVLSLMTPVFFQAIGGSLSSALLSLARQIFCLIPIFWLFSKIGLNYTWLAFPLSEIITGGIGWIMYRHQLRKWEADSPKRNSHTHGGKKIDMKMITAIVNKKDAQEVCQSLTEAGFFFTKTSTTGGFLSTGNTTLMIGTEDQLVEKAIDVIRHHCSRRVESIAPTAKVASSVSYPTEVTVGGATLFVTPVEHFEKI